MLNRIADPSFVQLGPTAVRFIVDAEDSNATHTVFEVAVRPEGKLPLPHSHDAFEETFIALDGTLVVTVDGVDHALEPGQGLCVKRGQVHAFRNETGSEVRFLCVAAPGIFGRPYFEDLAAAFASFGDEPPNPAVLGEVMQAPRADARASFLSAPRPEARTQLA
jgi:mannose-6-phosphate isomerase-like protein (cupin superfamily)